MDDSFEYGTIAETNEEHSPDSSQLINKELKKNRAFSAFNEQRNQQNDRKPKVPQQKKATKSMSPIDIKAKQKQKKSATKDKFKDLDISSLSSFSASEGEDMDTSRFNERDHEYYMNNNDQQEHQKQDGEHKDNNPNLDYDYREAVDKLIKAQKEAILMRPNTSYIPKTISQDIKNQNINTNSNKSQIVRPMTSSVKISNEKENQTLERPKTSAGYKPVYKTAYSQSLREKKIFNYNEKKFTTVIKKSDPVSRFQSFNKTWKKTSFLKNNAIKGKEGRKLNLAERHSLTKPDLIYLSFLPKTKQQNIV